MVDWPWDDGLISGGRRDPDTKQVDSFAGAVTKLVPGCPRIDVASAFFSLRSGGSVDRLFPPGCQARLVVRLGFPTDPNALEALLKRADINIRFFGPEFHAKFYLFHGRGALIGSANATEAGLSTNIEAGVFIDVDDPRFHALSMLFDDYWNQAVPLDEPTLLDYKERVWSKANAAVYQAQEVERELFGKNRYIFRPEDRSEADARQRMLEDFKRDYQQLVTAIETLESACQEIVDKIGRRKYDEQSLSIRAEVIGFTGWMGETHARSDKVPSNPTPWGGVQKQALEEHVQLWLESDDEYFVTQLAQSWAHVRETLGNKAWLEQCTRSELWEVLWHTHSFSSWIGRKGTPDGTSLESWYFDEAGFSAVRDTLLHLLHGPAPKGKNSIPERMVDCLLSGRKVFGIGRSTIMDLVGWVHAEHYPPVNGRTTRVLRFYGFEVPSL